jgi:hypothetical protein
MIDNIFSKISKMIESKIGPIRFDEYGEYLGAVKYHLSSADASVLSASNRLRSTNWSPNVRGTMVILDDIKPQLVVSDGDTAIREVCSAIDTFLCFTNFVLKLNIPKERVSWKKPGDRDGTVKRSLKENGIIGLHDAIDAIYTSIGYSLLVSYRNWVTHRGCPYVVFPNDSATMVILPQKIRDITDSSEKEKLIENYLLTEWPNEIIVECWPFCPPVALRYSARIDGVEKDIILPGGIHIGKGASVDLGDVSIIDGALTDDHATYTNKNKIQIEKGRKQVGGEELAIYSVTDYLSSIRNLVHTVDRVLNRVLDDALCKAYLTRNGLSIDNPK